MNANAVDNHGGQTCSACCSVLPSSPQLFVHDPWFRTPGIFRYLACTQPGCRSLTQHPQPSMEVLDSAYRGYFTHGASADLLLPRLRRIIGGERRATVLGLPKEPAGVLLDIGCGDGTDMLRFRTWGWRVIGVDNDPAARKVAADRGLDVYGALEELPPSTSPAVILMRHTIEHVPDPADFLFRLRRLATDRTTVIIATPNVLAFGRAIFGRWWRGYDAPRHLQIFSPGGLTMVAERAGYEVKEVRTGVSSVGGLEAAAFVLCCERVGLPGPAAYVVGRSLGFLVGALLLGIARLTGGQREEEIFLHVRPTEPTALPDLDAPMRV